MLEGINPSYLPTPVVGPDGTVFVAALAAAPPRGRNVKQKARFARPMRPHNFQFARPL